MEPSPRGPPLAPSVGSAASRLALPGLTEAEVEFLAEDEVVRVVPNFSLEPLDLACGAVGPFRPQMPVEVPLWLALALKKRQRCTIQTPDWMTAENLRRVVEEEKNGSAFSPLPFHYIEIAELIFLADKSGSDIQDLYTVRTLVEDVKAVRKNKIIAGLKTLKDATGAVQLSNLSAMEVTLMRPFLCTTLARLSQLDWSASAQAAEQDAAQPGSMMQD